MIHVLSPARRPPGGDIVWRDALPDYHVQMALVIVQRVSLDTDRYTILKNRFTEVGEISGAQLSALVAKAIKFSTTREWQEEEMRIAEELPRRLRV